MIDVYIDDVSLTDIQYKCNQPILVFKNKDKDEAVHMPISNEELINILRRVRMHCEAVDLIYPVNIKLKEEQS